MHTPAEELPVAFAEIHRVLAPGGLLLHAFKIGDGGRHLDTAYGHDLSLDVYWYRPELVWNLLAAAAFAEVATPSRPAIGSENTPQAFLLARKPQ